MESTVKPDKYAKTSYPILDVIANRWSPRAFEDREIEEDTVMKLFEAARWAPSSMNEQPWRFIYAKKGTKAHQDIVDTLMEGNKHWALKAPVLMLTLVKSHFSNGAPNKSARHDLGLAIGNLSIQATHEGIGLHQMGGFFPTKAKELFGIPESYEAVTAIALGYFGDPETLPETLKKRELSERQRLPIDQIVFKEALN
jgi:nitroreductase